MFPTRVAILACLLSVVLAGNIFYSKCLGKTVTEQYFCKLNFDNCTAQTIFKFPGGNEQLNYLFENAFHHCRQKMIAIPTYDRNAFGRKSPLLLLDLNTMKYKFLNLSSNLKIYSGGFDKEKPNLFYAFLGTPYTPHIYRIDIQTQTATKLQQLDGYQAFVATSDFDAENKILYTTINFNNFLAYDIKNQKILKDLRQKEYYLKSVGYDNMKKRVFVFGWDSGRDPHEHLYQLEGDSFKHVHSFEDRQFTGRAIDHNKLYLVSNLRNEVALTEFDLQTMQEVKIQKCNFPLVQGLIKSC